MANASIQAGERVRIVNIPDWLLSGLPAEDQARLRAQRGEIVTVLALMPHGYLWLAFSDGTEGFSLQPADVVAVY